MEDPLPLPLMRRYNPLMVLHNPTTKLFVALALCLVLSLTLIICPHLVFEDGKSGLWLIKLNSSINQAPRGGFFGALAILPQKIHPESLLLPQVWNFNKSQTVISIQQIRNWLVVVWFGSSYV